MNKDKWNFREVRTAHHHEIILEHEDGRIARVPYEEFEAYMDVTFSLLCRTYNQGQRDGPD